MPKMRSHVSKILPSLLMFQNNIFKRFKDMPKIIFPKINHKQSLLLIYKLLHDLSFVMFVIFLILILADAILPGVLSFHLSIPLFIFFMLLTLSIIGQIGRKFNLSYPLVSIRKNKFIPLFVIVIILLLGGSMLKFYLWENLLILSGTLCLLFLFYRIILRAEH